VIYLLAPTPRSALPSEKTYITTAPDGSTTRPKPLPCWYDEWLAHRKEADRTADRSDKHTGTIDEPEVYMLEEAIEFLDAEYGRTSLRQKTKANERAAKDDKGKIGGYEILIVNDGSKDKTVDVALAFSKRNNLHDIVRICTLKHNRGKGGAVTHGFRHVRGAFAVFADADGASRFRDLAKLVQGCGEVADEPGRGIAVGSRAHLVGSEAVVKVVSISIR
jgi:dolichyl-phosphate beta-glucosyltransferase